MIILLDFLHQKQKALTLMPNFQIQTAAAQSTKPSSALTVIELYSATPET
jgi:hypothetical protein